MRKIMIFFKSLRKPFFVVRLYFMRQTKKSRQQLRHQQLMWQGKGILSMDYIALVSRMLPHMEVNKKVVNHERKLRDFYLRYDIPGINYYIDFIIWKANLAVKKRQFKVSA